MREGRNRARRLVGNPVWTRAPGALLRYPGLFAAAIIGSLLMSFVAAAYPMFLSRNQAELLQKQIGSPTVTRYGAGVFYGMTNVGFREETPEGDRLMDRLNELFDRVSADGPHLDNPIRYALGPEADLTLPGGIEPISGSIPGRLFFGTGARRNVDLLAGSRDDDALIPDLIAQALRVGPGDVIELGGVQTLRVGGVYRSLYTQPRRGYWLPWSEQIYRGTGCLGCPLPPQFILVEQEQLFRLTRALGERTVDLAWVAPAAGLPLTLDQARELQLYTRTVLEEATHRRNELGRTFACCGTTFENAFSFRRDTEFRSSMTLVLSEVERRSAAVEGPIKLLFIAGLVVAAIMTGTAAAFGVVGRRTEASLLYIRGWSASAFGAKATIESTLPSVIGGIVGLAGAWYLLAAFGPGGPLAASGRQAALVGGAFATGGALVLMGMVSAATFIRRFETRTFYRALAALPWELVAIAGALVLLSVLRRGGGLVDDPTLGIRRPTSALFGFPFLLVAGFTALGARLLVGMLRRALPRSGRLAHAPYLALHRLTEAPRLTVLLVAAAAVCLGVFVNGQAMTRSLRTTVAAKAGLFVGSDVQVLIDYDAPHEERFPLPVTRATRLRYAGQLLPQGISFDMVGVDAATLAQAAYWDPSFSDDSLEDLAARLPSTEGPLPVLLVNGGDDPTRIQVAQTAVPIEVVGRAEAFPGVSSESPTIVADTASFETRLAAGGNPLRRPSARTQLWIKGDVEEALSAVGRLKAFPLGTLTTDQAKDVPFVAAAVSSFVMLNILGLAAAVLVLGILLVYMQARQRARAVAQALSQRMGMDASASRRALVLELGAVLAVAAVAGILLGSLAAALSVHLLDPLPTIPPAPLYRAPIVAGVGTITVLALVAMGGGWFVHHRASGMELGQILRVSE
jgi:hypothetical protein